MPLGAHLRELRRRIVLIFIGIALGTVGGWFLFDPLYSQMTAPLDSSVGIGDRDRDRMNQDAGEAGAAVPAEVKLQKVSHAASTVTIKAPAMCHAMVA